eukprot:15349961-Ditylum_brightwellii.AAC.1
MGSTTCHFPHKITSSLFLGTAVHQVAWVEELAREEDAINQALEEDRSCHLEYSPLFLPQVSPIVSKEEMRCREKVPEGTMTVKMMMT